MIGVIPAAGHGTRAYPYSRGIPKSMIEVAGQPNLERVVAIMRDQLRVSRLVIVVGAFGEAIEAHFGDGARFGIPIVYVRNDAVERGLGYSLLLARPFVDDHFCVILADECYVDANHEELLATDYRRSLATCAVQAGAPAEQIAQNYGVWIADGRVHRLVEKPTDSAGALLGLGTFIFSPEFLAHLDVALRPGTREPSDPVSVLGRLCAAGAPVAAFPLRGQYVNINDRDALNLAANLIRARLAPWRLALVLLLKGSADDARRSLQEFRALGRFDPIVLVLPPGVPPPLPASEVGCVVAASPGYGDMMRAGLDAVSGDVLITAQSDGSCLPRDVPKFLEYLKDADVVIGTRTTRQLIEQGSNMRGVVRLAHILLAKLLELVWWGYEPRFTDVGCAYRAIWGSTYRLIRERLHSHGPEYAVEMLVETLKCRKRVIEIPVSFGVRRRHVREPDQTLRTFVSILALIVRRRLGGSAA